MNSTIKSSITNPKLVTVNNEFTPSFGLRNPHIQTILSSIPPRKWQVLHAFSPYRRTQHEVILDCGEDSRLQGFYNQAGAKRADKLLILIHGWEGSHESTYMLSAAQALLDKGVDVFRLNLRDHGATHHLNRGLFYSTLLEEVVTAIELIQHQFAYQKYYLSGFSLGGNFALRTAASSQNRALELNKVIAFCPVIHAKECNEVLHDERNKIYNQYFVRRWKRSLLEKAKHWPEYPFVTQLDALPDLNAMNNALVPRYAGFDRVDDYFDAYAISEDYLENTAVPCYLHFAHDDMVIPIEGVKRLAKNTNLDISVTKYGGHCGFIKSWYGGNWQDERLIDLICGDDS